MTGLENWLKQATRHLSKDSAAQVQTEIRDHYESARDAAMTGGATADEGERRALTALGDAKTANRQYRRVLLTSAEARMLREGGREAQFLCGRRWVKRLALAAPLMVVLVVSVCAAAIAIDRAIFLGGALVALRIALIAGIGISPFLAALLLPVYTPSRSRIFRAAKWVAMIGAFLLAFGPDALKWSWLSIACLWPLAWTEWTRASIRRKLPMEKWPKHLYL